MAQTINTPANRERDEDRNRALNVPNVGLTDLVIPGGDNDAYFEDEDYRPEPMFQYGNVDTSDTGGGAHQSVAEVSPVFAQARAMNLMTAARALDPNDPSVGEEMVTLPQGTHTITGTAKTADEGRADIENALTQMADDPTVLGGPTSQQRLAAEEWDDEDGTRSGFHGQRFESLGGDKGARKSSSAGKPDSGRREATTKGATSTTSTTAGSPASGGAQRSTHVSK